jgi:hypothetical protein
MTLVQVPFFLPAAAVMKGGTEVRWASSGPEPTIVSLTGRRVGRIAAKALVRCRTPFRGISRPTTKSRSFALSDQFLVAPIASNRVIFVVCGARKMRRFSTPRSSKRSAAGLLGNKARDSGQQNFSCSMLKPTHFFLIGRRSITVDDDTWPQSACSTNRHKRRVLSIRSIQSYRAGRGAAAKISLDGNVSMQLDLSPPITRWRKPKIPVHSEPCSRRAKQTVKVDLQR